MKKLTKSEFLVKKREPLLDYATYESIFDDSIEGFELVRRGLSKSEDELSKINPYKLMASTQQRAWDASELLVTCFSGGHSIAELKQLYPTVLRYWEVYCNYLIEFLKWDVSSENAVAALALLDTDFIYANQLISFGILLGLGKELPRVSEIIDLNNFTKDGLLERLLVPYLSRPTPMPIDCTRHLPYFKSLKIFDAEPQERPLLMSEYLQDWYGASRREPYYDSHKKNDSFTGYWSWEAAAITYLLDIDDSSYRGIKFYPGDLVEFARNIHAPRGVEGNSGEEELRTKSGQACPKSGTWETLDIPLQQRKFAAGEIMQAQNASYGITVWRYLGE